MHFIVNAIPCLHVAFPPSLPLSSRAPVHCTHVHILNSNSPPISIPFSLSDSIFIDFLSHNIWNIFHFYRTRKFCHTELWRRVFCLFVCMYVLLDIYRFKKIYNADNVFMLQNKINNYNWNRDIINCLLSSIQIKCVCDNS